MAALSAFCRSRPWWSGIDDAVSANRAFCGRHHRGAPMKQDRLHSGLFMLGLALVAALVASPIAASSVLAALGLEVRETFPVSRLLDLARTHSAIAALAVLPAAAI